MSFWHSVTTLLLSPAFQQSLSNLIKAQSHSCYVEIAPRRVHFPQFHKTVRLSNLQCLILKVSQIKIAHLLIFWLLCCVKSSLCYIIWTMREEEEEKEGEGKEEERGRREEWGRRGGVGGGGTSNKKLPYSQYEKSDLLVVATQIRFLLYGRWGDN